MSWETPKDIDWRWIEKSLCGLLGQSFSAPPNPQPRFELVFWIDLNGGFNFDVYQRLPGDKSVRFGDVLPFWNKEITPMEEAFLPLVDRAGADDDFDAYTQMEEELRNVVREQAIGWANKNFGYSSGSEIRWRIHDQTPRPKDFP